MPSSFGGGGGGNAPIAIPESYSVIHGRVLRVGFGAGLLANDTDPNGDILDAVLDTLPFNGTVALNDDGSFLYTPNSDPMFVGWDFFVYHATDGDNSSEYALVQINVTNAMPLALPGAFSTHQGTAVSRGLFELVNDTDEDELSFTVGVAANGTVTVDAEGFFTYTPNAGFVGLDSFSYSVSDGLSAKGASIVNVNVTNTAPTLPSKSFRVHQGKTLTISPDELLANAIDGDSDELWLRDVIGPVSVDANGLITFEAPAATGTFTFQAKSFDGAEYSSPATFSITVENKDPRAAGSTHTLHQGGSVTFTPRMFDADDDSLNLIITQPPSNGTYSVLPTDAQHPSPRITYVPSSSPNFVGTDTLKFKVSDGAVKSSEVTVTFEVTDLPPIAFGAQYTLRPGQSVVVGAPAGTGTGPLYPTSGITGVLSSAVDPDDSSLMVSPSSQADDVNLSFGSLTLEANGYLVYEAGNLAGTDSYSYQVSDGALNSNVATLEFEVVNSAPVVLGRTFEAHVISSPGPATYSFDLSDGRTSISDRDGDELTFALVSGHPAVSLTSSGAVTFLAPSANWVGSYSFDVVVNDGFVNSATATMTIDITDDAPVARGDQFSIGHGKRLELTKAQLLQNDRDANGDPLKLIVGALTGPGTLEVPSDASGVTYVSPNAFTGTVSFTYVVSDGALVSLPATVTIEVLNSKPLLVSESFSTTNGTVSVAGVGLGASERGAAWDLEGDALSFSTVGSVPVGLTFIGATGEFTYSGSSSVTFQYKAFDGAEYSAPATVTIEVDDARPSVVFPTLTAPPLNYAPIAAVDGPYKAPHGRALSGFLAPLLNNDVDDGYQVLSISSGGLPATVPASLGSSTISYSVSDGVGTDTGSLVVQSTNRAPISSYNGYDYLGDRYWLVYADPATTVPPSSSSPSPPASPGRIGHLVDHDFFGCMGLYDPDGDPITATLIGAPPIYGTVSVVPSPSGPSLWGWEYNASPGFYDVVDAFTIEVTDDVGAQSRTTFHIAITNRPLWDWNLIVANDDQSTWGQSWETAVTGNVLANDKNPDGLPLNVAWNGTLPTGFTGNSDGTFSYLPSPSDIPTFMTGGGETISYTVTDTAGVGLTATASLTIVPKILEPGESAGGLGYSVANGDYGGLAPYTNGIGRILAYPDVSNSKLVINGVGGPSFVVSASGTGVGSSKVQWGGGGRSLILQVANADVADLVTGGYFRGSTDGSFEDVVAASILLTAGGDIGDVSGFEVVSASAGGNIGEIRTFQNVRAVDAGGDLKMVEAYGLIGTINVAGNISDIIKAGGDVRSVEVGGSIAKKVESVVRLAASWRRTSLVHESPPTKTLASWKPRRGWGAAAWSCIPSSRLRTVTFHGSRRMP